MDKIRDLFTREERKYDPSATTVISLSKKKKILDFGSLTPRKPLLLWDNAQSSDYAQFKAKETKKLKKLLENFGHEKFLRLDGIYARPQTFNPAAPYTSRRSTMATYAKFGSDYFPTSMLLDPLARNPLMVDHGRPIMNYDSEYDSDESLPETSRAQTRAKTGSYNEMKPKGMPISQRTSSSDISFLQTGRTLLNMNELSIWREQKPIKLYLFFVAWNLLTDAQLLQFFNQLGYSLENYPLFHSEKQLHNETIVKFIRACLKTHGLDSTSWKDGLPIVSTDPELYSSNKEIQNELANRGIQFNSQSKNAYQIAVLVDSSTVDKYYDEKRIVRRSDSTGKEEKRQLETSYLPNQGESKFRHASDYSIDNLADQIEALNELVKQASSKDSVGLIQLMTDHAEKSDELINELYVMQKYFTEREVLNENEIRNIRSKIVLLEKNKANLETELQNAEEAIQNAENKESKETQLQQEIDTKKNELKKKDIEVKELQESLLEVEQKLSDSVMQRHETELFRQNLSNSSKKNRQKLSKLIKSELNQSKPKVLDFDLDSDSEEDFESCDASPSKGFQIANISGSNTAFLTPSKAGLSPFRKEVENFNAWFKRHEIQIEYLGEKHSVADACRLILMCLPPDMLWITENITSEEKSTTEKLKMAIINKLYGRTGLISDMLNITRGMTEHPLAFLSRLKSSLMTGTSDIESEFSLKTIIELLRKNLDATLVVEFNRNLMSKSKITGFKDIQDALESAVTLTQMSRAPIAPQPVIQAAISQPSEYQKAPKSKGKYCSYCKKNNHTTNECFRKRNSANAREPKDAKDGRKPRFCTWCRKTSHSEKYCWRKRDGKPRITED